jgi:hypothetical protein
VIRGPGIVGPLDRLADVGPSDERPADRPEPVTPAKPTPPDREALEQRLDKWFVERERFEGRARPKPPMREGSPPDPP